VIFSLFGRKEGRAGTRKREPGDAARILPAPGTGRGADQDQREIARLTAAKIDEIESQMISGRPAAPRSAAQASHAGAVFVPSGARAGTADRALAPVVPAPPVAAAVPLAAAAPAVPVLGPGAPVADRDGQRVSQPVDALAPLEFTSVPAECAAPSTIGATHADSGGAMEIAASELLPMFEEAAVLFSNGQGVAAATVLLQEIDGDTLGAHVRHGWAMLFDIYQTTGRQSEYEALALRFSARFETSPPTWDPALAPPVADSRAQQGSSAVVMLPASLDAQVVRQLEQLQRNAQRSRWVALDVSAVRTVDPVGADLLLRVLVAFRNASRDLVLVETESLRAVMAGMIEAGRRDPSDACWLLQLELLRALDRQQEFEDLSIDYCVTYEVSPPSWEPAATPVRDGKPNGGHARATEAGLSAFSSTPEAFVLLGEIEGRAQKMLVALREHASGRTDTIIDCRRLRRLDFVAAGELLNEVVALRGAGKYLVFKDVNQVVAALLVVMGIPGLAEVRRRAA
jgi:anti-anti-sigma regulatory factor